MRRCSSCGRDYQPKVARQRFCSSTCSERFRGPRRRQRRGTTTERGYGAAFEAEKRRWKPIVEAGQAYCWRPNCGQWIDPTERDAKGHVMWHLGHDDHDRSIIRGPEHRRCNLSAAAKIGNARRGAPGVVSYRPRIV